MNDRAERIIRKWGDCTLYHFNNIIYELIPCGKLDGQRIIASDDADALEQATQIRRRKINP